MSSSVLAPRAALTRNLRIAFYSHDTVGLGHIRRNLAVASAMVASSPDLNVVLITGNPEAARLPLPPHTDLITLPTVAKGPDGHYCSRKLRMPVDRVLDLRAEIIDAAIGSFEPDLLVVDKVPQGVRGELLPALRRLRTTGRTKTVLGLREVLDEPVTAVREWEQMKATETIADFYDAVWVYGDPSVYDPVVEYGLPPEVASKISYTGYLAHDRFFGAATLSPVDHTDPEGPYVLCTVGGGQDGADVAHAFVQATLPDGHRGLLVCGPFMSAECRAGLHWAAAHRPQMTVVDFDPRVDILIAQAAAVVSMAGYNAVCEVLVSETPALLVPRARPRAEQSVRAKRLAELGVAEILSTDQLSPARLSAWLAVSVRGSTQTSARAAATIDLDGLRRIPSMLRVLLAGREVNHHAA